MKQQKRFILPLDVGNIVKDVSPEAKIGEAYLINEEELNKVATRLTELGWKYEERPNSCCVHSVLISPDGETTIKILKAGRTLREVVDEMWSWLKRHKNKTMLLEMYTFNGVFRQKFLELFLIVEIVEREESGPAFIVKLKPTTRKRQFRKLVEFFIGPRYYKVEYRYENEDYFEGWGLESEEDEKIVLWKEMSCDVWLEDNDEILLQVIE